MAVKATLEAREDHIMKGRKVAGRHANVALQVRACMVVAAVHMLHFMMCVISVESQGTRQKIVITEIRMRGRATEVRTRTRE